MPEHKEPQSPQLPDHFDLYMQENYGDNWYRPEQALGLYEDDPLSQITPITSPTTPPTPTEVYALGMATEIGVAWQFFKLLGQSVVRTEIRRATLSDMSDAVSLGEFQGFYLVDDNNNQQWAASTTRYYQARTIAQSGQSNFFSDWFPTIPVSGTTLAAGSTNTDLQNRVATFAAKIQGLHLLASAIPSVAFTSAVGGGGGSVTSAVFTSVRNTLSNQISVLSQAVSVLSQQVSALSQSVSSQAAALSVRIDTQSQAISVLSQQASVLSQALSVLSQVVSTISVQVVSALSIANAASNAASVVSQALSSQAAALSVRIDTQSQSISVLSQQISVLSQAVSVISQQVSALSQSVSVLSQAVSVLSVRIAPMGQCRLSVATVSTLILEPYNGSRLWINGSAYSVPSATTLTNSALSAGVTYNVYAFISATSVLTLEATTSAHSRDTTAGNVGVEIKTGDSTRTLVGMVRFDTPALNFLDSVTRRLVINWFNRLPKSLVVAPADSTTSSTTYVEVDANNTLAWLAWGTEAVYMAIAGGMRALGVTGVNPRGFVSIGLDSIVSAQDLVTFCLTTFAETPSGIDSGIGAGLWVVPSEGYHTTTMLFRVSNAAGTCRVLQLSNAAGERSTLLGMIAG